MKPLHAAAASAGFITFVNLYAPQSLLPTLATTFSSSAAETGLTITTTLIAVAIIDPFAGGISDAFGRRRLIAPACRRFLLDLIVQSAAVALTWLAWPREKALR